MSDKMTAILEDIKKKHDAVNTGTADLLSIKVGDLAYMYYSGLNTVVYQTLNKDTSWAYIPEGPNTSRLIAAVQSAQVARMQNQLDPSFRADVTLVVDNNMYLISVSIIVG
jgi:hypothetical protein